MRVSRRCDETICFGGVCIAKNAGVVNRIDAIHARRMHEPAQVGVSVVIPARQGHGSSAEDERRGEGDLGLDQHFQISIFGLPH